MKNLDHRLRDTKFDQHIKDEILDMKKSRSKLRSIDLGIQSLNNRSKNFIIKTLDLQMKR